MTGRSCPVVGIGASAGGLDSLQTFFRNLPADTGAAYVVVQHLAPDHPSLGAEILGRATAMETHQITDGMAVEPNHVYVIPPNTYAEIKHDTLRLREPQLVQGLRMPIDTFFFSLAEECRERAIVIVLSGTGRDGTLGLRAVKANGGLVLAESPDSAAYGGMPQSAIATGLVDIDCPVEQLPAQLGQLQQVEAEDAADGIPEADGEGEETLREILTVLFERTGRDFRVYKEGTIRRRIARRMRLYRISKLQDYLSFITAKDNEAQYLFRDLMIGVTSFFRDREAFEALDRQVIAKLVQDRKEDDPIRIWVPACSSGEEAYSVAMLCIERLESARMDVPIQVFATDIDAAALALGRSGSYPENAAADIPPNRLKRFFIKDDHSYRVTGALRDTVTFAEQDLIADPPFSRLDLVCCRNLLIYLQPEVQRKLLALFGFALKDRGYLFLGQSETIGEQEALFTPVSKKWRLYQRRKAALMPRVEFPIGTAQPRSRPQPAAPTAVSVQRRFSEVVQRHLVREFAPAAVLVDQKFQVVYFSGATTPYLAQPVGAPTGGC